MPLLPLRTIDFSDTQPALGTTPADADNGTATFTLHRDIAYAAVGQVSQPATLQDAVLSVTGSYNDAVAGAATFSIQVTGNPTTGFTTTVSETGTNAFATLNVTVTADDGWLDDFVNQIDQTVNAQFGVAQSDNPGGSVVSSQAGTAGGTTITHGPDGSTTTQIFDSANHLLSDVTTDSNGNVLTSVTYTYDTAGNQTSETNGTGSNASTTLWTYDSAGNKTSETLGAGTADAATTTYGYTDGNLTSVTDPDGNTTLYSYDVNGRQISMTDPLGNVQTQGYTAAGQLAWVIDRDSQLTTYAYDNNGNLITETMYSGATDTTAVVDTLTWTYNADGTVATAGNDQGTYVFQYNSSGQIIHVDEPSGVSLTFGYDSAGNRVLVEDSLGGVEQSSYNAAGQLMSRTLTQGDVVLRIDFTYTSQGQIATETRYSDAAGTDLVATTTYSYDALGNISSIVSTDAFGNPIANYAYTTDAAGDLTSQTENGVTSDFSYDAQGELIGDTIGESTSGGTGDSSGEGTGTGAATSTTAYSYDANGNRTNPGYVTGPDNELLSDGTWDYSYDKDGDETEKVNIATGVTWTYGYDDRHEMTEAKEWSENPSTYGTAYVEVQEDFKYDVYGNRVEQDLWSSGPATSAEVVTKFAVDGWNPAKGTPVGNENFDVWADLTGTGALQTRYLRGDAVDQLLARIDNSGSSLSPYWELTDRLGSVRDVIDNNTGAVQDAITYDSYGNITSQTNAACLGRYAWTGREFDVETDLQYNRARYYDPSTGRWMSQDPLGFDAGDSNLYRYVNNQPTDFTDPTGTQKRVLLGFTYDEMLKLGVPQSSIDFYKETGALPFADVGDLLKKAGLSGPVGTYGVTHTDLSDSKGMPVLAPSGRPIKGIVITNLKTGKLERIGWELGYGGKYYGMTLFDTEKEMQDNYAAFLGILRVVNDQVVPFLAGAGVGIALQSLQSQPRVGAPQRFNFSQRFQGMSNRQLGDAIGREQTELLRQWMGSGAQGARNAMGRPLPAGLTADTLRAYREIARRQIAAQLDTVATQQARTRLIEEALRNLER